ncbi:MAG: amidohydrolase family protein, partial [Vicinamibacteria bacterium]
MRAWLTLLIAIGLASLLSAPAQSESSSQDVLVVLGGTLIDGTGSQPRPIAAIEIRNGSFTQIVPAGTRYEAPDGALRIDARGRTVVPGIWDMHVHLGADDEASLRANLGALLASGVTGALSTSDPTDLIVAVRERLRARELSGPRVFTCGASITPPGGHPGPYVRLITGTKDDPLASRPGPLAGSPEDSRQAVRNRVGKKVDAIKLIIEDGPPFSHKAETARMSYEVAAAAVSEARAAGLPVFAHVSSSAEAKDAVRAGVRGLVHSIVEDEMDEELLADLRSRGVGYVTTLSLYEGLLEFTGPDAPWDDPFLARWVAPRELTESRDPAFLSRLAPLVAWAGAGISPARSNLRRALDSGLTVALG